MKTRRRVRSALKWLAPGMGVKRWLLLLACGIAFLSLGISSLFGELHPLPDALHYATLQFIPRGPRAALFGLAGTAAVTFALIRLNRALLEPFVRADPATVANAVRQHRRRSRGPKVVAIGGGHGLSVLLRGLKQHTSNVTAIVTVADDGGSSGRLRRELGVLPPGDLRNCIAALADDEALMTQLFQYRFPATSRLVSPSDHRAVPSTKPAPSMTEGPRTGDNGLDGHSFGNLFITAMAEVTGSFERAVLESERVLAIQGRVLPSTLQDVTLMAELQTEPAGLSRVTGQSSIIETVGAIERVYLEPEGAPAYPGAVRALLEADLIVAGPGSLYTSVLPNLLIADIAQAVAASRARKVYVCNVATQPGETDGYSASDHVAALEAHVGNRLFSAIVINDNMEVNLGAFPEVKLVPADLPPGAGYRVVAADLIDPDHPWRHDSDKLAQALLHLL